MKTFYKLPVLALLITACFTSCKKDKKTSPVGALGANYPYGLNAIITPAIIDTLKLHGMIINDGLKPPTANGIYLLSPNYCTFDNSGDGRVGDLFDDALFKFSNQNNSTSTIDMVYKQGDDNASETGTTKNAIYITGTNNSFTIYAQAKDTLSYGNSVVSLVLDEIISGTLTSNGIANMQFGFYAVSKGADPDGIAVPAGSTRIFEDEDKLSSIESTYAVKPSVIVQSLTAKHAGQLFSIRTARKN